MFVKQQLQSSLQQALKLATAVEACVHSTGVSTAKLSTVTYTKIQDFANRMKAVLYQQGTLWNPMLKLVCMRVCAAKAVLYTFELCTVQYSSIGNLLYMSVPHRTNL